MAFSDKLTVVIDFVTGPAQSGVKKLRTEVAQAEGAMGKMKAATVGVGGALNQYAGQAAMAAAAALVAFGVKSVKAFQDTALAAGEFSDAAGIAVEDASRWTEVAGDLGIEAGAVQGAILKMNKALGDGKSVFSDYGVEVVKTKDGMVDSNATFINAISTIGAIEDPTKRAQAAQQVFGKSYASVAQLMEMSAGDLQAALRGVSDSKIVDQRELRNAREFRAAMDNLKDRLEDVTLTVGGGLVPVLTDLADGIAAVDDAARKLGAEGGLGDVLVAAWRSSGANQIIDTFRDVADVVGLGGEELEDFGGRAEYYASRIKEAGIQAAITTRTEEEAADAREESNKQTEIAEKRFRDATNAAEDYRSKIEEMFGEERDAIQRQRDFAESLKDLAEALDDTSVSLDDQMDAAIEASEAYATLNGASLNTEAGTRRQIESLYNLAVSLAPNSPLRQALLGYIEELGKIPPEVNTRLKLNISSGATTTAGGDVIGRRYVPGQPNYVGATGGIVTRPTLATIGEAGPEAVVPLDRAPGASPLPTGRTSGGGDVYNIAIYPKTLPTDRELIDLINNVRRRNGNVI